MRDILFRGKSKDGDGWIEGYYFRGFDPYSEDGTPIRHCIADLPPFGSEVYEYTVGQYTGLKDKNGRKVFEGDILRIARLSDGMGTYYFPAAEYPAKVVVKWDFCAWQWEVVGQRDKYYIHFPDAWCHYECEVIGNIYDNPELIGG